ncbi:MAG: hypothetical protein IT561_18455, partial [Alphaproteobacteria bacterium]|nr:hypothetical protein [Alphaproteobacteria bacterium]
MAEFANARIPAFGIRDTDGELVALEAALWRAPLFIAAEMGYGGSTGATKDPGLAFVGGRKFDLRSPRSSVLPIIAERDLLEALGATKLPPGPTILPADMPGDASPPKDRAEAARWWLLGYAEAMARPQTLDRNVAAKLCQDSTGCTIDEG